MFHLMPDQNYYRPLSLVKPLFLLTRPANVFIGMLSITVGAFVAGSFSPWSNILLASLSGGMIAAAANSINDYYDISIDRINKPDRPLPANKIAPFHAVIVANLLFVVGISLAIFIRPLAFFIALSSSILLYLYSSHFKRTLLMGNLIVSYVSGLAFIYGGIAVNKLHIAIIPAGFAFFFHFGREILKDIEDMKGDQLNKANTFPIRYGLNSARGLISIIFLLLVFLTFLPYIYMIFGKIYLIIVFSGVDLFLFFVIYSLWKDPSKNNLHRLSEWLKIDMFLGLLAIIAGVYLG